MSKLECHYCGGPAILEKENTEFVWYKCANKGDTTCAVIFKRKKEVKSGPKKGKK